MTKPDAQIDVGSRMLLVLNADYQLVEIELHFDKENKHPSDYLTFSLTPFEAGQLAKALNAVSEKADTMPFPNRCPVFSSN